MSHAYHGGIKLLWRIMEAVVATRDRHADATDGDDLLSVAAPGGINEPT